MELSNAYKKITERRYVITILTVSSFQEIHFFIQSEEDWKI